MNKNNSSGLKPQVRKLRESGKTYSEIREILKITTPKSTLSSWCKGVTLPSFYQDKVRVINLDNLHKARKLAVAKNKIKRKEFLYSLDQINLPISRVIMHKKNAKVALALLCLGEASKYKTGRGAFTLGSSDRRIIIIFLELLKLCFDFNIEKVRCTVQCRADQDVVRLENYWQDVTRIPRRLFYKTRVDPRTIGKPTKKKDYKGVLRIDYMDSRVHLELESLASLIYNQLDRARSLKG